MSVAIINDYNAKMFDCNGIRYVRNFIAIRRGNIVTIRNAYDSRFALISGHFSEFIVNGNIFLDAPSLTSTLSSMIFVKDEVEMTGSGESDNSTVEAVFYNALGVWVNTPETPGTGAIAINLAGSVNGGTSAVYLKASSLSITGGTIVIQSGTFIPNELCLIFIVYDKGSNGFHVNIMTGFTGNLPSGPGPDIESPATMRITNVVFLSSGDTESPAIMEITSVSSDDSVAPATMEITSIS